MKTIVLTGGGSAGHVSPHLTLLPFLKNDFKNIYYIGSDTGIERSIIEKTDIPYYSVDCAKLNREFTFKNFKMPFTVLKGIRQAEKLLKKLKPDVIFSKGGYVSLPTVIAGYNKKIPVISHESDLTVGLANKIASRFSKKVLTTFPETAKKIKNGLYVGSPIKPVKNYARDSLLKDFNFNDKKPILLVIGGSLGAKAINDAVRLALPILTERFDILHICGKGNIENGLQNKSYIQLEWTDKIEKAFSIADVCISRAGANSILELLAYKLPSILIPLPCSASRGDQILNAEYFYKKGLVYLLKQELLTPSSLSLAVNSAYANRLNIKKSLENCEFIDKSREISRIICDHAL